MIHTECTDVRSFQNVLGTFVPVNMSRYQSDNFKPSIAIAIPVIKYINVIYRESYMLPKC